MPAQRLGSNRCDGWHCLQATLQELADGQAKVQEDLAHTRQYVRERCASVHELVRDVREQCDQAVRWDHLRSV